MHKFLKKKKRLGTEGAQLFPQKPTICDPRCTNVPKEKTGFRIQDVHLSQSKLGPWTQGGKLLEKDWDLGFQVSQNKGMRLKMHKFLHRKARIWDSKYTAPPPQTNQDL